MIWTVFECYVLDLIFKLKVNGLTVFRFKYVSFIYLDLLLCENMAIMCHYMMLCDVIIDFYVL